MKIEIYLNQDQQDLIVKNILLQLPDNKEKDANVEKQSILLMRERGFSLREIGKILGVSGQTINNKLKNYNMCKWDGGDYSNTKVLNIKGVDRNIDKCIYPLVKALNGAGLETIQSCCGHGQRNGRISLKDGREIIITDYDFAQKIDKLTNPQKEREKIIDECIKVFLDYNVSWGQLDNLRDKTLEQLEKLKN